jgi:tetratricopeptide (TPR) repeat protein
MILNEDDINLIDNYLNGNLRQEEKALFELKMSEKYFSDEFKLRASIIKGIEEFNRNQLKAELRSYLSDHVKIENENRSGKINFLSIAAAIVIILMSSLWILLHNKNSDTPDEIFAAYYKPYPVAITTRSGQENLIPAFEKYQENHYQEAVVLLERIGSDEKKNVGNPFLQLIIGNCYLKMDRFDKATIAFQSVIDSNDLVLKQHAEWYMALTLLKSERIGESLAILGQIKAARSFYSKNAESLIKRIKKKSELNS